MDFRLWTGVGFVRRAPTKGAGETRLRVADLSLRQIVWWHSHVQPIIDEDSSRADNGWNWLLYVPFSELAGRVLQHRPVGYSVGLEVEGEHFVPCALVQLLGGYRDLEDHTKRSTYAWFLTTAPVAALVSIPEYRLTEDSVPKRLGSIALDVAVTHSINHRGRGRVALYAAREGGDKLLQWYQDRGMLVLPPERRIPRGPRRLIFPSDGRYCYFTAEGGLEFSRSLDPLR